LNITSKSAPLNLIWASKKVLDEKKKKLTSPGYRFVHSEFKFGLLVSKVVVDMPYAAAIVAQVSPDTITYVVLQS
jgi:hypothetical protein